MKAWSVTYPVRLRCGHLAAYTGTPACPGQRVWCPRCDAAATVGERYYDPDRPTGWCGVMEGDGRDRLRCTLDRGHGGDKHLDAPRDAWFTARERLRSGRQGSCP